MEFESQFYKPLDLQRAARNQYGPAASLISTGDHLYDWKAQVGKELKDLDLKLAVTQQYSKGWTLVAVGVHKFDWKALRFDEPEYRVLPIMLIASDHFYDIAGVRLALDRFQSVLVNIQNWYDMRVNSTIRILKPLVLSTQLTSTRWNDVSDITQFPQHRYDLLNEAIEIYEQQLPAPGANLRVVLAPYTGQSIDVWLGAAASGRLLYHRVLQALIVLRRGHSMPAAQMPRTPLVMNWDIRLAWAIRVSFTLVLRVPIRSWRRVALPLLFCLKGRFAS